MCKVYCILQNCVADFQRGQIADLLKKDKSTISTWMNGGRTGFSVKDAMAVRREFFPNMTLDYLFSEEPITVATASVR